MEHIAITMLLGHIWRYCDSLCDLIWQGVNLTCTVESQKSAQRVRRSPNSSSSFWRGLPSPGMCLRRWQRTGLNAVWIGVLLTYSIWDSKLESNFIKCYWTQTLVTGITPDLKMRNVFLFSFELLCYLKLYNLLRRAWFVQDSAKQGLDLGLVGFDCVWTDHSAGKNSETECLMPGVKCKGLWSHIQIQMAC